MAAGTATAAKVAATIASDSKARKVTIYIILIVVVLIITPAMAFYAMTQSAKEINFDSEISAALANSLSPEDRASLERINEVMTSLKTEYDALEENIPTSFVTLQIFFIYMFAELPELPEGFYTDFVSCFIDAEINEEMYDNISSKFGITLTDKEKEDLFRMTQNTGKFTIDSSGALLPPQPLHLYIKSITDSNRFILNDGGIESPFKSINYKNVITSGYGGRYDPINGYANASHPALDLGVPTGTDVHPIKGGVVIVSKYNDGGFGYYVVVNHGNGVASLYGHNSKLLVNVGDKVTKDTVIAKSGSTGRSTGPHVHLEIIVDGQPVDPAKNLP